MTLSGLATGSSECYLTNRYEFCQNEASSTGPLNCIEEYLLENPGYWVAYLV